MRDRARLIRYGALSAILSAVLVSPALAQQPVRYRVSFPAPEHHYAQVEVTFSDVPAGALEARMSARNGGLFVGRLAAEAGAGVLLEALDLYPGACVDFVGAGPEAARLREHPRARLLGRVASDEGTSLN